MRAVIAFGAMFILSSAISLAMSVKASYSTETDFSGYRTYTWEPRPETDPEHPLAEGGPVDRIVKQTADPILAKRGFERIEGDDPDFRIYFTGVVMDKMDVEGIKRQVSEGVAWIGDPHAHSTRSYKEGTLVIEILDAAGDELIWSGWASEVASSQPKLRKKAAKAVRRILEQFPPQ
jgi:hypothetical protein